MKTKRVSFGSLPPFIGACYMVCLLLDTLRIEGCELRVVVRHWRQISTVSCASKRVFQYKSSLKLH